VVKKFPGAPGAHPVCPHAGFQSDLHGEQRRLHPVLTGHHLGTDIAVVPRTRTSRRSVARP
jgi:hypothetical protein